MSDLVLRAIALAMGIATVVLVVFKAADVIVYVSLLSIGVLALALAGFIGRNK